MVLLHCMVLPCGGYGDGHCKVWDARTGKVQTQTEKMPDMVSSLAMEGNIAAAGDYDGNLMVCDVRTGEEQSTMETMPARSAASPWRVTLLSRASWSSTPTVAAPALVWVA